jgi:Restriction endonuclease
MTDPDPPQRAKDVLFDLSMVEASAGAIREEIQNLASQAQAEARKLARDREVIEGLVADRTAAYPLVAAVWADYEIAKANAEAKELATKKRPAPVAAEAVREKGRELAEVRRQAKLADYIVQLYEWHFPWLTELRDVEEAASFVAEGSNSDVDQKDPVGDWLTAEEFRALPEAERNQWALDRYLKSRKSPWQLGRDYERYVGYLREQEGCAVTYHGIAKGLEDLGRDVLAERDGSIEVIQCKRWAQAKTIHEKHVFQLYGTMILARLENPAKAVTGTLTTTTKLSPKAREVADYLEIKVEEGFPLDDYPRIKCNLARRGEDRIYHLPFDQQYDTTVIEPERGELYLATVAEAEAQGFRRAWRWKGGAGD